MCGWDPEYAARIRSLRRILDGVDFELATFAKMIAARLVNHPGYQAIQALAGIDPVLTGILIAEIGDIGRFRTPEQLCCWAGLTPSIASQTPRLAPAGSPAQSNRLVHWACVQWSESAADP